MRTTDLNISRDKGCCQSIGQASPSTPCGAPRNQTAELSDPICSTLSRDIIKQSGETFFQTALSLGKEINAFTVCGETRADIFRVLKSAIPTKVMTEETWENSELDKFLLSTVNISSERELPRSGKLYEFIALFRACRELPIDVAAIKLRQEISKELSEESDTAKAYREFSDKYPLSSVMKVLAGTKTEDQYAWYRDSMDLIRNLVRDADLLPEPRSQILKEIRKTLNAVKETDFARHARHGTYFTHKGIQPADEVTTFNHAFKFWPFEFDPVFHPLIAAVGAGAAITGAALASMGQGQNGFTAVMVAAACGVGGYILKGGRNVANELLIMKPLTGLAREELTPLLSSIACMNEFFLLSDFDRNSNQPCSFPDLNVGRAGSASFKGLGSSLHPRLKPTDDLTPAATQAIRSQQACRLNDIEVTNDGITAFVGPNSGGKTYLMKALFHAIVKAQLGGKALCKEGVLTPFSQFVFIKPKQNNSDSPEGTLGEELAPLAPVLRSGLNSKTLIMIDELGRGTAEEAIAPKALEILETICAARARMVLTSHNQTLIRNLSQHTIALNTYHPELLRTTEGDLLLTCRILPGFPPATSTPTTYVEAVAQRVGLGSAVLAELRAAFLRDVEAEKQLVDSSNRSGQ